MYRLVYFDAKGEQRSIIHSDLDKVKEIEKSLIVCGNTIVGIYTF